MAQQTINIGSSASDGTGDELRVAFDKINDNFTELYATSEYGGLTYANVAQGATSGSGTGARFTVSRFANSYTVDLVSGFAGTGYAASDTITVFGNVLGGTSGVNDVTVTVATLSNVTVGNIATVTAVGAPANPVLSVNGQTGDVTLTVNNIDNAASKGYVVNAINGNVATLNANFTSVNANVTAANSAISTHTTQISTLDANVGTLWGNVGTLSATKATISYVDTSIDNALSSNAVLANVTSINANVAAANAAIATNTSQIATWRANLGVQQLTLDALDANVGTLRGATTTTIAQLLSNAATQQTQIVNLQLEDDNLWNNAKAQAATLAAHDANIGAHEAQYETLRSNVGTIVGTTIPTLDANLGTATTNISTLDANLGTATTNINTIQVDITALTNNAASQGAQLRTIDANLGGVGPVLNTLTANAATQAGQLATLTANAATQDASLTALTSNSVTQHNQIRTLDANVGGITLEIDNIFANLGQNYANVDAVNSNISAINVSIATLDANVGSYQQYANANLGTATTNITTLDANLGTQTTRIDYIGVNYANTATSATFTGNVSAPYLLASANVKVDGGIEVGLAPQESFPGQGGFFGGNVDSYYQVIVQNFSNSSSASSDFVINADDATDTNNYVNLGINSSNWTGNFADSGQPEFPHDGYFATIGGNSAVKSTANVFLVANTATAGLLVDGDFFLGNGVGLSFPDGTRQTSAFLGTYADLNAAIYDFHGYANVEFQSQQANVGSYQTYANTQITALLANAVAQQLEIDSIGSAATDALRANITAANVEIDTLQANVGAFQTYSNLEFTTLDSNLGTVTTNITTLFANAGVQAAVLDSLSGNAVTQQTELISLLANAASQADDLTTLLANAAAQADDLTTLTSNASSQATAIDSINANVGSYQTYANATFASASDVTTLDANLGTATTNIETLDANVGAYQSWANVTNDGTQANLGTATTNITTIDANIGTITTDLTTLDANIGAFQTVTNASIATLDANLGTVVGTTIPAIDANIGSFQTYANANFGSSSFGNADVAAYLPGYTGSMTSLDTVTTVTLNATTGNITSLTSDSGVFETLNVNGNAIVNGNLTVANLNSIASHTIEVQDPLLYLTANTVYPYNYDIGFFSQFTGGSANVYQHSGFVRDYTDDEWKLFSNVDAEPGATIDWADPDIIWDRIRVGNVTVANATAASSTTTGALIVAGGAGIAGNVHAPHVVATTSVQSPVFNGASHTGTTGAFTGNVSASHLNVTNSVQAATVNGTTVNAGTLQIGAASVTATAAELNLVDGSVADTVVNNKAVIYSSAGNIRATHMVVASSVQASTFNGATHTGTTATFTGNITSQDHLNVTNSVQAATVNGTTVNAGTLQIGATSITSTAAEINKLDGFTGTAADLNYAKDLNATGVTTVEFDKLDGLTSSTAELNLVDGSIAGTIVNSKAVVYGASGEVNATTLQIGGSSITATAAELNKLDGVTATTGELNILDGVTSTAAELNLLDGATANTIVNSKSVIYSSVGNVSVSHLIATGSVQAAAGNFAGNVDAGWFNGTSTSALYADLAENYTADVEYAPGTVVVFGGAEEVTVTNVSHDERVAGIVSTDPAYLMNSGNGSVAVGLTGRLPCRVKGPVNKGTLLVTSDTPGVAQALDKAQWTPGCVIGKSLEVIEDDTVATIEVAVGRD